MMGKNNYLVFQSVYRYFKTTAISNKVTAEKSKGLSDEIIKPLVVLNNNIDPGTKYIDNI